jgi:RNA polymerase sigma factor (sigma-70 family)
LAYKIKAEVLEDTLKQLAQNRGAESAWATLYRSLWPFVIAIVYRHVGARRDRAEDVAQEVFMKLVKFCDFGAFPNAPAFLGYLNAIARNAARDSFRRLLDEEGAEDISRAENVPTREPEQNRAEANLLLGKIFADLDLEEREMVKYLLEGYTLKEISQFMHQTYGALAVRFHRLRTRLKSI